MYQTDVLNVPDRADIVSARVHNVEQDEMMRKRRKKYTLHQERTEEMLEMYSAGLPRWIICEEYNIAPQTLRRLISEYEAKNGEHSLRLVKIIKYKGYKHRLSFDSYEI
jgi:hypothetical protein